MTETGNHRTRNWLRTLAGWCAIGLVFNLVIACALMWRAGYAGLSWEQWPDGMESRRLGVAVRIEAASTDPAEDRVTVTTHVGWPLPTLAKRNVHLANPPSPGPGMIWIRPPYMSHVELLKRPWTYRPLAVGTILNSAVYAAALAGLVYGLSALRRQRRRAQGRCERCAQPGSHGEICPECGARRAPRQCDT